MSDDSIGMFGIFGIFGMFGMFLLNATYITMNPLMNAITELNDVGKKRDVTILE